MIQLIIVITVIFFFITKVFYELHIFKLAGSKQPGVENLISSIKWLNVAALIMCGGIAWHTMEMRDLHNIQEAKIDTIKGLILELQPIKKG